ncbi:PREDICTED: rac GTPase-activating protein 1 [Lipotes vexillifer]|uniref:Rac GTPase-activating protein 1 n=1 Tax=Lipotes vexillifer TaxID=118797 RepID=A0A340WZX8_LIPVE|nr:PREDICTED: rac GTPase-activating protein 1 [Lipotes vexillifer]
MDTLMLNMRNVFEQLVRRMEILSEGNEVQFIQLAKDFEEFRKKWQRTDHELGKYKDLLMKVETERSALDVKLKHARNQVDVEIKRRQRAEADCEKLERQIQLIREMLMCDTSGSIQLSEEQRSALAFLNRGQPSSGNAGNKRWGNCICCYLIISHTAVIKITDEDNSIAAMYQAVGELPQANRDTLAFLMIHLQRVAQSPSTKMDVANLAKVFGPTIVAHAVPNPDPVIMLQDIKRQPKVVERLLSLPLEYWSQFMMVEQENIDPMHVIENSNAFSTPQTPVKVSLLGPVTTPEHQLLKTPSSSSLSQRVRSTLTKNTPRFGSKSKSATNLGRQGNFFASPMLK